MNSTGIGVHGLMTLPSHQSSMAQTHLWEVMDLSSHTTDLLQEEELFGFHPAKVVVA